MSPHQFRAPPCVKPGVTPPPGVWTPPEIPPWRPTGKPKPPSPKPEGHPPG